MITNHLCTNQRSRSTHAHTHTHNFLRKNPRVIHLVSVRVAKERNLVKCSSDFRGATMAFFNRVGSLLKQTVSKHVSSELSAPNPSIFQSIRSMSSSKLFVGGLSYNTDEMSLRESFSQYGEVVEARIIMDRDTGRSRGFGFITFTSTEAASSAIQAFDGQDLHGRRIRVNYATDRPRTGGFGGGFGSGGGYGDQGGNYGRGGYQGGGYGGSGGGNYSGGDGNYSGGSGGYGGGNQYPSGGSGGYGGGNQYPSGGAGGFGGGSTYSGGFGGGNNYPSGGGGFDTNNYPSGGGGGYVGGDSVPGEGNYSGSGSGSNHISGSQSSFSFPSEETTAPSGESLGHNDVLDGNDDEDDYANTKG
ncbi:hypothetical protein ACJIZ3_002005 [Penstemon smallii]|uniref:RRM domain-containing protein n=1 Tax=Penstemon smallii TaxID=265156 RepID=A0ABD3U6D7_9LAMI